MKLRSRDKVRQADTWDLSSLFKSEEEWEKGFRRFQRESKKFGQFRGTLDQSASQLAACLAFDSKLDRLAERLGVYAFLRTTEDQSHSGAQELLGRFQSAATKASEAASFIRPEVMAMSDTKIKKFCREQPMEPYRLLIDRWRRYKPHTLGEGEEQILAMQGEMAQAASRIFRQLLDADMKFGTLEDEQGRQVELTNTTFSQFLISPKRSVRKAAFHQYYQQFSDHQNALTASLASSVQKDVYYARVRGHDSALGASLFADNVPASVYDNLIASVRKHLPALHEYYELRRRKMRLKQIHHYDTYVPLLSELSKRRTWKQAVSTILDALTPLGEEYGSVLADGLTGRWCDRYPNKDKQSGAFSCGTFDGDPYILMNYKPDVLDDMFTLAHEAGHSMHSYYSAKHQPFEYYNYTIFVAEVASTFNEQLLSHHLLQQAGDERERAYLINRDIDAIRGTIIRQTMFAEFEKIIHEQVEQGSPLTVKSIKEIYGSLLRDYFGPNFTLDEELQLECLRIPHFYRAFYVYKYATGLSAAIALSERVLRGGDAELQDYLGFLKGGCSKYPIDLLRDAGVDMERPQPVNAALRHFEKLVHELETLL
ncbi:MAG: oligoendopeptidase F [Planctomycetota bacterium]